MNRRDVLSSLSSWAAAASAVAASDHISIPSRVEGWKPTVLPMDFKVHHIPPEQALLVFRLTQCVPSEHVDYLRKEISRWIKDSGLQCAAILLPFGLELDVHRIPVAMSAAGDNPKE